VNKVSAHAHMFSVAPPTEYACSLAIKIYCTAGSPSAIASSPRSAAPRSVLSYICQRPRSARSDKSVRFACSAFTPTAQTRAFRRAHSLPMMAPAGPRAAFRISGSQSAQADLHSPARPFATAHRSARQRPAAATDPGVPVCSLPGASADWRAAGGTHRTAHRPGAMEI
jgi:hypothetical protein